MTIEHISREAPKIISLITRKRHPDNSSSPQCIVQRDIALPSQKVLHLQYDSGLTNMYYYMVFYYEGTGIGISDGAVRDALLAMKGDAAANDRTKRGIKHEYHHFAFDYAMRQTPPAYFTIKDLFLCDTLKPEMNVFVDRLKRERAYKKTIPQDIAPRTQFILHELFAYFSEANEGNSINGNRGIVEAAINVFKKVQQWHPEMYSYLQSLGIIDNQEYMQDGIAIEATLNEIAQEVGERKPYLLAGNV